MKAADDRAYWLKKGGDYEHEFVSRYGSRLGLQVNRDKKKDKYAPDLEYTDGPGKAELKTQNTRFRASDTLFGIPPVYAFTFDESAALRYSLYYPRLDIYLWDHAGQGVYYVNMSKLVDYLPTCPKYRIKSREELGSATDTVFIMDLRNKIFERLI